MSQEPNSNEAEEEEEVTLGSRLGASGTMLVLFYDHWFAIIALCILLSGVFLCLFIPRIWPQTPAGMVPVVKVSGLDLWQASSLRKSAARDLAAGHFNEAMIAWRSAIANNPGDAGTIREALRALLDQPQSEPEQLGFGVRNAFWLLHLGRTNAADLEMTIDVLRKFELDDYVMSVAGPYRDGLSPAGKMKLERAYFDLGNLREFDRFWVKNAELFGKDEEMMLYRQAWLASEGTGGNPIQAQEALAKARANPKLRVLANRLQLSVSYSRQDLAGFGEALKVLEDEHADRMGHHVYQWLLLHSSGRTEEAREMARNYTRPPGTPSETSLAASGLYRIGLAENAIAYLDQHIPRFRFEPELWLTQGRMLIEAKRWDDLRALALAIRNESSLQSKIDAYSYFAETIAESRLGRPEVAAAASDKVARASVPSSVLAREMARSLRTEGFSKTAVQVLAPWKTEMKDNPEFWFEYAVSAFGANADDEILEASKRAYELRPSDTSAAHNRAAALIAFRRQPEEAIRLTLRVAAARPGDPDSILNHVLALLQNGRDADAEAIVHGMNTLNFNPSQSTVYYLGLFELNLHRKEWALARASYGRIDPHELLAVQARWLDEAFRAIPTTN